MNGAEEIIPVPWFDAEHYATILAIMEDAATLPSHYECWLRGAEERLSAIRSRACRACAVRIEPATFLDWCRAHDLPPDSMSRTEYACEFALTEEQSFH